MNNNVRPNPDSPDEGDNTLSFPGIKPVRAKTTSPLVNLATTLVVLVTGLRRGGIGHAICRRLASDGHIVYVLERDEKGRQVADEIRAAGGNIRFCVGDAAEPMDVQGVMDEIERRHAVLHGLICNAGDAGAAGVPDNLLDLGVEGFARLWRANFQSAVVPTCAALKQFFVRQPEPGVVVFMGTVSGRAGNASQVGYSAAKAGLGILTRYLSVNFGQQVRPYLLLLGTILTQSPGWETRFLVDPDYDKIEGLKFPIGRLITGEEVAELTTLLLRPEAALLSGAEIPCSGGADNCGYVLPGVYDRDDYVRLIRRLLGDSLGEEAA